MMIRVIPAAVGIYGYTPGLFMDENKITLDRF
jgi:hypothetical protein